MKIQILEERRARASAVVMVVAAATTGIFLNPTHLDPNLFS
jgi:hypothetical protein